jgi:hypothetical protein
MEASIAEMGETLRPDFALVAPKHIETAGQAHLLIALYPPGQALDRPVAGRHWKANPGDTAIRRWIRSQLEGTTVTVALIGAETAGREWVRFEILESWNRGNGIVGVRIHNVKDMNRKTDSYGANPFDSFKLPDGSLLSSVCEIYAWVNDDGRNNLGSWSQEAVEIRKKVGLTKMITEVQLVGKRANASAGVLQAVGASRGFTPRAPWCPDYGKR